MSVARRPITSGLGLRPLGSEYRRGGRVMWILAALAIVAISAGAFAIGRAGSAAEGSSPPPWSPARAAPAGVITSSIGPAASIADLPSGEQQAPAQAKHPRSHQSTRAKAGAGAVHGSGTSTTGSTTASTPSSSQSSNPTSTSAPAESEPAPAATESAPPASEAPPSSQPTPSSSPSSGSGTTGKGSSQNQSSGSFASSE